MPILTLHSKVDQNLGHYILKDIILKVLFFFKFTQFFNYQIFTFIATATNDTIVSIKEIKDRYRYNKDLHVFRTRCLAYGETKINLEVGNTPSPTLTNPASTFSTVKVICAKPETLIIRPRMKSTCPQQEMTFTLEKNKNIELDVQVLDGNGNQFYNFSTLYFEWTKDGTGAFEFLNGVSEEVNGAKGYFSLTRSKQVLKGLVSVRSRIRAHITGYQRSYFGDRFSVQREIDLILTNPTSLAENNLSILKHSDYKVIYFEFFFNILF